MLTKVYIIPILEAPKKHLNLLHKCQAEQVEKMKKLGMNPEEFETYLMLHKYGAPPHGGLGIGLERLTMHLLGAKNVREATMFPRDINRVAP